MAKQLKDSVPPHNIDAEQATLGAILGDWSAMDTAVKILTADKFYSIQNQKIFKVLVDMSVNGIKADYLSVVEELSKQGELESCGGAAYITELAGKVPTSANIEYYANVVLDQAVRRDLIKTASNLVLYAHDERKQYSEVLEAAQKEIFELTDVSSKQSYKSVRELVVKTIDLITELRKAGKSLSGISSGFPDLDKLTSGFQDSEMIIIGARPSIGKTALALSMLHDISIINKIPAAFFSLEMADIQVMQRLLCMNAQVNASRVRDGFLSNAEMNQLTGACGRIYESPLYIVDSPNMNLLDLRAVARRLKESADIKIMFVDYIGLIGGLPGQKDYERVSEASRSLKSLARELKIPVVALSQVGRPSEGNIPTLAQLRDSGSIEQDADMVLFLHRDREKKDGDSDKPQEEVKYVDTIPTQLIIAKQRNGPIGTVNLLYQSQYTKFVTAVKSNSNY